VDLISVHCSVPSSTKYVYSEESMDEQVDGASVEFASVVFAFASSRLRTASASSNSIHHFNPKPSQSEHCL
jgi:hypothetical protein